MARPILGLMPLCVYYYAFQRLPLGDIAMIRSSSTLFACIHGRIFLKEPIEKINVVNVVIVLAGIVLMVQPPIIFGSSEDLIYHTDPQALYVALACLIAAFIEPLKNVVIRRLKGRNLFPLFFDKYLRRKNGPKFSEPIKIKKIPRAGFEPAT